MAVSVLAEAGLLVGVADDSKAAASKRLLL